MIALTFLLTLEDAIVFARAGMWAATWDCNRDEETRARASRKCTSDGNLAAWTHCQAEWPIEPLGVAWGNENRHIRAAN